jgi:hypothetical protein
MISYANQVALQAVGLSFVLGARIPQLPDVVLSAANGCYDPDSPRPGHALDHHPLRSSICLTAN